ncbi:MAG TPA: helix-turn-helix domain-containing protein [Jatrophihabitans sp.]|jgi:hypothetical protein
MLTSDGASASAGTPTDHDAEEPTVSLEALADELGLPAQQLQRWVRTGHGPRALTAAAAGGEVRFTRHAVNAWLLGH